MKENKKITINISIDVTKCVEYIINSGMCDGDMVNAIRALPIKELLNEKLEHIEKRNKK